MESWIPLFDIFLNSPTPETEASLWLQKSFNSSSSSSSPVNTISFLSLLTKPCNLSSSDTVSVMYIQTLPSIVQSRILSFLVCERKRFCARDLARLARGVLGEGREVDFWVKRAAYNLLDVLSESSYEWISGLNLDSGEEGMVVDEFGGLPDWLKEKMGSGGSVLPWLPLSGDRMEAGSLFESDDEDSLGRVGETEEQEAGENDVDEVVDMKIDGPKKVHCDPELGRMAESLKTRLMDFESTSKTVSLANEIRELRLEKGGDSFSLLEMIEPWKVDDESASVLVAHLSGGNEDELGWPSQVLCSVVLPKILVLEVPISRLLLTSVIEYCKLYPKDAVYALLFPLILRREGINNPICDVVTRIVKECLHPGHVSAFCHKVLCGERDEWRLICLPCHQHLISDELVWTESLFNLFQSILNHNVHLTQDSVDSFVCQVQRLTERFSDSLKFGNFLLCLVTKCPLSLRAHKHSLIKAVEHTNTLVTKSLLSKLHAL